MSRSLVVFVAALCWALAGCASDRADERSFATRPDTQADYKLFAVRCSKCHSLARPLNSGIDDDDYWRMYVARMRRQPSSGISEEDTVAILRFLHVFSQEERRRKEEKRGDTREVPPGLEGPADAGADGH